MLCGVDYFSSTSNNMRQYHQCVRQRVSFAFYVENVTMLFEPSLCTPREYSDRYCLVLFSQGHGAPNYTGG